MHIFLPAKSFEENVVALGSELDAPEKAHGGVAPLGVLEHDRVQVLHCDPPMNIGKSSIGLIPIN